MTTLAGALLWLVALWVALGLALTAASLLPGQTGRIARGLAHRLTPAVLRRAMVTAAGASILLSPATALAVPAAGSAATPGAAPAATQPVMPAVGWVTDPSPSAATGGRTPVPVAPAQSGTTSPSATSPSTTAPRRSSPPGSSTDPAPSTPTTTTGPPLPGSAFPSPPSTPAHPNAGNPVTVRPGDSLWSIAARHLATDRSAARIAQAWPRWYAANRQAIGSRPDLIRPGTRLVAPPLNGSESGSEPGA
ncbi:MAG: LysM peptidoglycan-binding domain-containing protein [Actinobacteria bacterium]|nr:LysM peptidoglycan-binding domain-containing protein [Actinomycetota bacterium]